MCVCVCVLFSVRMVGMIPMTIGMIPMTIGMIPMIVILSSYSQPQPIADEKLQ